MNFFVFGLPRSRTAWISVFLTDDQVCLHEGVIYPDYEELLLNPNIDGDSTTCYPMVKKYLTDEKVLIIERDIKECLKSSQKFCNADTGRLEVLKDELDKAPGLRINYNDIDNRLEEIWGYCKGTYFNPLRAETMKRLNIQNIELMQKVSRMVA